MERFSFWGKEKARRDVGRSLSEAGRLDDQVQVVQHRGRVARERHGRGRHRAARGAQVPLREPLRVGDDGQDGVGRHRAADARLVVARDRVARGPGGVGGRLVVDRDDDPDRVRRPADLGVEGPAQHELGRVVHRLGAVAVRGHARHHGVERHVAGQALRHRDAVRVARIRRIHQREADVRVGADRGRPALHGRDHRRDDAAHRAGSVDDEDDVGLERRERLAHALVVQGVVGARVAVVVEAVAAQEAALVHGRLLAVAGRPAAGHAELRAAAADADAGGAVRAGVAGLGERLARHRLVGQAVAVVIEQVALFRMIAVRHRAVAVHADARGIEAAVRPLARHVVDLVAGRAGAVGDEAPSGLVADGREVARVLRDDRAVGIGADAQAVDAPVGAGAADVAAGSAVARVRQQVDAIVAALGRHGLLVFGRADGVRLAGSGAACRGQRSDRQETRENEA